MNAIYYECVNEKIFLTKSGRGRTYKLYLFTCPLLYHLHHHILLLY
jgi:hypothetical protein